MHVIHGMCRQVASQKNKLLLGVKIWSPLTYSIINPMKETVCNLQSYDVTSLLY